MGRTAPAIAIEPEVILLDEPCSAPDPVSTAKVESLMHELKAEYTLVIVTHNMQQASRVSDYTAFPYMGSLVEMGTTEQLFLKPREQATEDYITVSGDHAPAARGVTRPSSPSPRDTSSRRGGAARDNMSSPAPAWSPRGPSFVGRPWAAPWHPPCSLRVSRLHGNPRRKEA